MTSPRSDNRNFTYSHTHSPTCTSPPSLPLPSEHRFKRATLVVHNYVLATLQSDATDEPTTTLPAIKGETPDAKRAKIAANLLPPVTASAIHDALVHWPGRCMVKDDLRRKLGMTYSMRRFGLVLTELKRKQLVKEEERRVRHVLWAQRRRTSELGLERRLSC